MHFVFFWHAQDLTDISNAIQLVGSWFKNIIPNIFFISCQGNLFLNVRFSRLSLLHFSFFFGKKPLLSNSTSSTLLSYRLPVPFSLNQKGNLALDSFNFMILYLKLGTYSSKGLNYWVKELFGCQYLSTSFWKR